MRAAFIGSSVCVGSGAADNRGWSRMLAEDFEKAGWETWNCAIGGQTTADILLRLERDVIAKQPDVCFVGLGLANEGLGGTADETAAAVVRGIFESNLKKIVSALKKAGILPILGGVYPNNGYKPYQTDALRASHRAISTWGVEVLNWLDALDDGSGHFREGLYYNGGHPNDEGYRVMYRQIPDDLIPRLEETVKNK